MFFHVKMNLKRMVKLSNGFVMLLRKAQMNLKLKQKKSKQIQMENCLDNIILKDYNALCFTKCFINNNVLMSVDFLKKVIDGVIKC